MSVLGAYVSILSIFCYLVNWHS